MDQLMLPFEPSDPGLVRRKRRRAPKGGLPDFVRWGDAEWRTPKPPARLPLPGLPAVTYGSTKRC